jgi:hypothetical protein
MASPSVGHRGGGLSGILFFGIGVSSSVGHIAGGCGSTALRLWVRGSICRDRSLAVGSEASSQKAGGMGRRTRGYEAQMRKMLLSHIEGYEVYTREGI